MPGLTTHDEPPVEARSRPARRPLSRFQIALEVIAAGVFLTPVGWGLMFGVGAGVAALAALLIVLGVALAVISK
jgi:hypothetical protein